MEEIQTDSDILTPKEAAKYLRLKSVAALYNYNYRRLVPYIKICRKVLYRKSDLDKFLSNHTVQAI